ncbi:MAG TPA: hypothetical protein VLM05_17200 [Mycobacteriales bacterium]|nr:hypothetical protein [Mycobacteriales bacterium]
MSAVFGSATGAGRALREHDAAVRAPLPLCRRIGFVHLVPGIGGSTLAAQVATVLARRRAGMVLAVDASPSPHGLLPLLDVPPGPTAPVRPGTAAEVRAALTRAPAGCYTLDLRPAATALRTPSRPAGPAGGLDAASPASPASPAGGGGGVGGAAWSAGVGPVARFFDVVVTDWGLRHPAHDLEPVLSTSHAVCLVVRPEDAGAAAALVRTLPPTPPVVLAAAGRRLGPRQHLRLAAELMRPSRGDRRDR